MGDRLAWPWRRPRAAPDRTAPGADDHDLADTLPHLENDATRPIARSLFGEILDWMLAPLLLLWPMSIAVTYLVAKSIANAPYDRALESSAIVLSQQLHEVNGRVTLQLPISAREILRADETDNIYYQVLGSSGEFVSGDRDLPLPPRRTPAPAAWCNCATTASTVRRSAWRTPMCSSPAPGPRWCRWPRRWTSARSWPTRSSRV